MRTNLIAAFACISIIVAGGAAIASGQSTPVTPGPVENPKPDCKGQKSLSKKTYRADRWWQTADPTPATNSEDYKLDRFVKRGCPTSIRKRQKAQYGRYYRTEIAPCVHNGERFVNCHVAECESNYGHNPEGHAYTYGFTVYWHTEAVLPKWGKHTRTGHRFAPSEPESTHIENNVFAAAAYKYGPTPGTC